MRGRILERKIWLNPRLNLGSRDLVLKMDLKYDFRHKNKWGLGFMDCFASKPSRNGGFWSENEREEPIFKKRMRSGLLNEREKMNS